MRKGGPKPWLERPDNLVYVYCTWYGTDWYSTNRHCSTNTQHKHVPTKSARFPNTTSVVSHSKGKTRDSSSI